MSSIFFNDTATTEIYTLSLHDALPIYRREEYEENSGCLSADGDGRPLLNGLRLEPERRRSSDHGDRKSTRLNSSHANISYAVFCLLHLLCLPELYLPLTLWHHGSHIPV